MADVFFVPETPWSCETSAISSRGDRQFKLRGMLVAPEEIEARLHGIVGVARAAVLKRRLGVRDILVAFVESRSLTDSAIVDELHRDLPAWMVPGRFVFMDSLPLTSTGKVDLQALGNSEISEISFELEQVEESPRSGREAILRGILCEVLGVDIFGWDTSFEALGGDSFSAMEVIVRAEELGIGLVPGQLAKGATLRSLVESPRQGDVMRADVLRREVEVLARELERGFSYGSGCGCGCW